MPGIREDEHPERHEAVRDYCGRALGGTRDLKANACSTANALPAAQKAGGEAGMGGACC